MRQRGGGAAAARRPRDTAAAAIHTTASYYCRLVALQSHWYPRRLDAARATGSRRRPRPYFLSLSGATSETGSHGLPLTGRISAVLSRSRTRQRARPSAPVGQVAVVEAPVLSHPSHSRRLPASCRSSSGTGPWRQYWKKERVASPLPCHCMKTPQSWLASYSLRPEPLPVEALAVGGLHEDGGAVDDRRREREARVALLARPRAVHVLGVILCAAADQQCLPLPGPLRQEVVSCESFSMSALAPAALQRAVRTMLSFPDPTRSRQDTFGSASNRLSSEYPSFFFCGASTHSASSSQRPKPSGPRQVPSLAVLKEKRREDLHAPRRASSSRRERPGARATRQRKRSSSSSRKRLAHRTCARPETLGGV